MLRILIFSFVSFILSCSVFQKEIQNDEAIEFTSSRNCSGRGGQSIYIKSIKKDVTTIIKESRKLGKDTLIYKTDKNKWMELKSLIDFNEFKKEMQDVGGNSHSFDGCNNTFSIKTKDTTFVKYNSKITSDKLKQFYELCNQM